MSDEQAEPDKGFIICQRVSDEMPVHVASTQRTCVLCLEPVWCSNVMMEVILRGEVIELCIQCAYENIDKYGIDEVHVHEAQREKLGDELIEFAKQLTGVETQRKYMESYLDLVERRKKLFSD